MIITDQITALAREYAEEMIKGKPSEELPNCLKNSMLTMNTEYVTEIFQWLIRRFYIVEKSKIREAYKDAQKDQHNSEGDFALTLAGRNRSSVLIDLFPEIAKEVNHECS